MVYPFESAAFTTPKGKISNPFRTRFGYTFVKVEDVRDNRGEVTVEHIMLLNGDSDKPEDLAAKENKIQDIYKKFFKAKILKT
jgi:peptidyl-prolyl cis-trans isomerase SurA